MPSRRSRSYSPGDEVRRHSASPERRRERKRENSRERDLPAGAQPISESDYFKKNTEFSTWLKKEKDRYFNELSGEKARSYFRKFVKEWNRGKLSRSYYEGIDSTHQPSSSQTSYKWSFTKGSRAKSTDEEARRDADTSQASSSRRMQGPTLPSRDDLVLLRESAEDQRMAERAYARKRERAEDKERIEDLVGPRESGREGALEKKRMKRESDRSFRDARDDAFGDYDESTLMGGGDSFQAHIARRDAAKQRFQEKRSSERDDKASTLRVRQEAMRERDKATMEMFKQMAKAKYG